MFIFCSLKQIYIKIANKESRTKYCINVFFMIYLQPSHFSYMQGRARGVDYLIYPPPMPPFQKVALLPLIVLYDILAAMPLEVNIGRRGGGGGGRNHV